jgi:hypothetical protein
MKMLFLSPIVLALSTYMAIVYGYLYLLFTTLTLVFEGTYHFSQGAVGLAYVSSECRAAPEPCVLPSLFSFQASSTIIDLSLARHWMRFNLRVDSVRLLVR